MRIPIFRAVARLETILGLPPFFFGAALGIGGATFAAMPTYRVFAAILAVVTSGGIFFVLSRRNPFLQQDFFSKIQSKKPRTPGRARIARFVPALLACLLVVRDATAAGPGLPQAPELIEYFTAVGVAAGLFGILGLIGVFATPHLRRFLKQPPVTPIRDRIPFDFVETDTGIIHLANGSLCIVIAVPGIGESLLNEATVKERFQLRQRWLLSIKSKPLLVRFVTIRHKQHAETPCFHENVVLRQIHHAWETAFSGTVYQNDHYIFISTPKGKNDNRRALVDAAVGCCDSLDTYSAYRLQPDASTADPLLAVLWHYTNCQPATLPTPPAPDGRIANLTGTPDGPGILSGPTVDFDLDSPTIRLTSGGDALYQAQMSIHGWGDDAESDGVRALLRQPHEMIFVRTLKPQHHDSIVGRLSRRRSQARAVITNPTVDQEYADVIEWVGSDRDTMFTSQASLIVQAGTVEELRAATTAMIRAGHRHHMTLIAEPYPLSQDLWFDRFPGNDELRRPWNLSGAANAVLASFEDEPPGLYSTSWSDYPIRSIPTIDGTLYHFNFQDSKASQSRGHFCVIAPTESGKTTLINFLLAGALNIPDVRVFAFDSQEGGRHALTLFGGSYFDVTVRSEVELNPLHVPDSAEDRDQLFRFFVQLSGASDSASQAAILRAVNSVFDIRDLKRRSLDQLMQDSIDIGTPFHDGMKKWTTGGRYSGWFNAARDTLDFSTGQLYGFEMAQALKEPEGAAALIEYITYRIRQHCTKAGLKHVIFCDEAARLFQDKTFASNAKTWFRESRKLDGVIGVAFQEPSALAELGIQDTIWDACSTFFLFPNRQARRDDYAAFQLTDPQWDYISGNHDYVNQRGLRRTCLVIRPTRRESVILDIDLNRLGPLVRSFRSGTEANAALTAYRTEHGSSPTWHEDYLGV